MKGKKKKRYRRKRMKRRHTHKEKYMKRIKKMEIRKGKKREEIGTKYERAQKRVKAKE